MTDLSQSEIKSKTKHPLFNSYAAMIRRCYKTKDASFKNYGARGIMVCDEWKNNFWQFAKDVGPRPTPQHSIDRIDNSLGYFPGNVKWSTPKEQSSNRRSNVNITYQGKTKCITQWCEELGVHRNTLLYRLKRGLSLDKVLTRYRIDSRMWTFEGKTLSLYEWAETTGIPHKTLVKRWTRGWAAKKALTQKLGNI
jgi:hypothetical protein